MFLEDRQKVWSQERKNWGALLLRSAALVSPGCECFDVVRKGASTILRTQYAVLLRKCLSEVDTGRWGGSIFGPDVDDRDLEGCPQRAD